MDEELITDVFNELGITTESFVFIGGASDEIGEPNIFIGHDIFDFYFDEKYPRISIKKLISEYFSGHCSKNHYDVCELKKLRDAIEAGINDAIKGLSPKEWDKEEE